MKNRNKKSGDSAFLNVMTIVFGILALWAIGWVFKQELIAISDEGGITLNHILFIIKVVLACIVTGACYIIFEKSKKVKALKENEYDEKILKKVIAELVPNAIFDRDKCIQPEALYEKGIIPRHDTYRKLGVLSYKKEGKEYGFSDIHLLRSKEDKDNRTYYETIYKGQVYIVNYATELQGAVRIFATRRMAVINVETDDGYVRRRKGERKIETENIMFNDNFDVYATSEQSAFYVLSPYVMEQLLEMKKKYNQVGVYISGNNVVISLNTDSIIFPKKMYFNGRETEYLQEAKGEVKKVLRMAEVLENTINGSIKNNFTNTIK